MATKSKQKKNKKKSGGPKPPKRQRLSKVKGTAPISKSKKGGKK